MRSLQSKLPPEFQFAGFTFPKYVFTLPKGTFEKRLERARNPVCGPYYHAPTPNQKEGRGFYLESDGAPGLRWEWCDKISSSINHTGWWTDEHGDGDTIRGVVFRLPHGRGFLCGWSMGEGMASSIDTSYLYDDESSAATAADDSAKYAAEAQREYEAEQRWENDE